LANEPSGDARFATLPGVLTQPKKYGDFTKALKEKLYRSQRFSVWKCAALKLVSKAGETAGDFRVRATQAMRERRDVEVQKLGVKYKPKMQALEDSTRKAQQKVEKEKSQVREQSMSSVLSIGSSVLGAIFGRKLSSVTNMNKAVSGVKSAQRASREKQDVVAAEEELEVLQQKRTDLDAQFAKETEALQSEFDPANLVIEEVAVQPRKTDVTIGRVTLCWTPWTVDATGIATKAW
jgi:hypothetical protein